MVLAAAVGLCSFGPQSSALADDGCTDGCVSVAILGAGDAPLYTRTLSLAEIQSVADRSQGDRYGSYDSAYNSTSVHAVIVDLLHVAPGQVDSFDLRKPNGGTVTLSGGELQSPPGPYPPGPPVFFQVGTASVAFLRPKRDEADDADRDRIDAREIDASVHTSGVLLPVAVEGPTSTTANTPATYRVTTPVPPDATVSWDFDDGGTAVGTEATHRWTAVSASTYQVRAYVQASDGGGVGTTEVSVDKAPDADPGPTGGGGGAANGPRTGGPGQGKQAGGTPAKGGSGGGGPGQQGNGPDGTASGSTSGTHGATTSRSAQDAARQRGKQQRRTATGGEQVQGVLLDAAAAKVVPAPSASSPEVASATTRAATDLPTDWRWLLAGIPVLLVLLGVARQTPWLARRLPEPPWRTS